MSFIKKLLIMLSAITLIGIVGVFIYSLNRTFYNDEEEQGNWAGNIMNGGLFCEQDDIIYFSNDNDNGSLYAMISGGTQFKKLHDDKAVYLNADENYIYYIRANNTRENNNAGILMFNNTGMYRINQNGKNMKVISSNPGSHLTLKGNYLYYQNYDVDSGLYLFRQKIDGSLERLLLKESVIPSAIMEGRLYFAGFEKNHNLNSLDLSSLTTRTDIKGNIAYPMFIGDFIYYLDLNDNYAIKRMGRDGSDPTVLVDERSSTYNITTSGKYLYYQIDDQENSRISRINLETMETELISEGNFKQIHVTKNYVFFKDFNNTNTYIQEADGKLDISVFNPPNLSTTTKK